MGNSSFDMSCSIVKVVDGAEIEAAKGLAVVVCYNYKASQPIPIPESWKAKMYGN